MAVVSVKPTLQIMALELPAASAHNRRQPWRIRPWHRHRSSAPSAQRWEPRRWWG